MRLNKFKWSLAAGALTLSVFGVAAARTGSLLGAPAMRLFGAPADIQAPRELDIPQDQQLAIGHQISMRMDQAAMTVRGQLEAARAAKDVVKALCLNDKLSQIDVASRSTKDRMVVLQGAVDSKDKDRSKHEFMILGVLRERVEQLVKEANQCIGEETGFIGDSHVSMEVDPSIPDNDPSKLGNDTDIISEPPVSSSPTM
ncbi:MAG TPA: hypothetical protein VHE30_26545 [Polyangiaceae bacterium]|nr:hypothetical protein [Polyangiaceae bacterium]